MIRPLRGGQCVATIGNFDGVHVGHQAIIAALRAVSKRYALPALVITFEPMPREFLLGAEAPLRIMTFQEKFEALRAGGVDVLCVLSFNKAMASLSAEDFIQSILVKTLGVRHLVVGEDFRFGKDQQGNTSVLQEAGKRIKFGVDVLPTVLLDGEKISSTRVRAALKAGKSEYVEKLLGRIT